MAEDTLFELPDPQAPKSEGVLAENGYPFENCVP